MPPTPTSPRLLIIRLFRSFSEIAHLQWIAHQTLDRMAPAI